MTRALIIGGGIAGPTTAMALQRVGLDAVLYEAHPRTAHEVGSYFTVTTNGLDALRAIGALHTATAIGFPTYKNVLWNDRGRRLETIPLGEPLPDGTASQTIKRARLLGHFRMKRSDAGFTSSSASAWLLPPRMQTDGLSHASRTARRRRATCSSAPMASTLCWRHAQPDPGE